MNGRPQSKRSSEDEPRKVYPRINFRVDRELRAKIELDAAAQGLTVGSYLRWLAHDSPRTRAVRRPLPDEKLLAQLKGGAGRVDGNIAQLLKLANRGEIIAPDELADAAKAVREFYAAALEMLRGGH
jgi:Mobilization protein NikA